MATATDVRVKKGSRVVNAVDLRGVPEGTAGKVKMINGFDWLRAWVEFDNGVWMGSISADQLVPEDDWEDFKVRRVQEAEDAERRAAEAAAAPPVAAAADAGAGEAAGGGAVDSKVPAHLLERSRAARERIAAARAAGE